ncbi:MAG: hypothetical protein OES57_11850 [Acidimicrobiia bacterium]|nr:hypothetical protein [Acidimicrobiia bacterium]
MQGNTETTSITQTHRGRWIIVVVAATAVVIALAFTFARADASEGPTQQRVVVVSDGDSLQLLGSLGYAGFVGFESTGANGAVERVMRVNEEPHVLAGEINRTLGPMFTAKVVDVD